ncbi:MAG: GAF domain-containing protein [Desulfuromonas sp.]|nr:GAF domain-containing protein [Desulfuromonas sp.]
MSSDTQQQRLLRAYHEIGNELVSMTSLPKLLNKILQIAEDLFQFDNAIIRLLTEDGTELELAASYGYPPSAQQQKIHIGQGVMGAVAASAQPLLINNIDDCPYYIEGITGANSALCVPLLVRERVIGVFNVESPRVQAFNQDDVAALATVANQAAIAIENFRLYARSSQLKQRYRHLHQFNESILQSTNLGIYTLDANLCITSWNKRMEKVSAMSEDQVLGRPLLTLFPVLANEGFDKRLNLVLKTGQAEKVELVHYNHKGQRRVQKRRLSPLRQGEDTTGVVIVVEDITEFKGLLDQMIQAEKLAEIGRLSSGIAHEINNPLAVIAYAAQLLLREEPISAFQTELLQRVESEVERLQALTGGLLGFSRSGEHQKIAVDVNEVIAQVLTLIGYQVQRGEHEVVENYGQIPAVLGDANQLKQVFINVIMNAAQAMSTAGKLTITTQAQDGQVEIVISDTGHGVDAEKQEQLFEPFYTTKEEGVGTGLGLYLCRKIVNDHAGKIAFVPTIAQGSSVMIKLPACTITPAVD